MADNGRMLAPLPLDGADLLWDPAWLVPADAARLFADLHAAIAWETHRIRMFGRWVDSPRRSCWIGDPQARYRYSGADFEPRPWPPALAPVRERLAAELGGPFNSVLANLYRDGHDAMGWHADDEPELGPEPVIASLSLGQPRRFVLRSRADPAHRLALELPPGSLLVMRGPTQARFQHSLQRSRRAPGARINLTFRRILATPR
jgi:alkylated DNA repair dioxygenase AlkB